MSLDPPCIYDNGRFTTVQRYNGTTVQRYNGTTVQRYNGTFTNCLFKYELDMNANTFPFKKPEVYLAFKFLIKGTVVNRTLPSFHGGSLKNTVP